MIKSVYSNQPDIMRAISKLYVGPRFHLDPTYGRGNIHKGIMDPEIKSDISSPFAKYNLNCLEMPFRENEIKSIIFDPPFLAGGGKTGIMNQKYTSYKSIEDLFSFYDLAMKEFYRVLKNKGFLVFKCQDICNGRIQTFSHCEIYVRALGIGFYARDIFVLTAKTRPKPHNFKNQAHARKFHTYFWVFQKNKMRNKTY